jgi:hypothetical protein
MFIHDQIVNELATQGFKYVGDGFFLNSDDIQVLANPISYIEKTYKFTVFNGNDYAGSTQDMFDIKSLLER